MDTSNNDLMIKIREKLDSLTKSINVISSLLSESINEMKAEGLDVEKVKLECGLTETLSNLNKSLNSIHANMGNSSVMSSNIYKFRSFAISDTNVNTAYKLWESLVAGRYRIEPHTITSVLKLDLSLKVISPYFDSLPEPKTDLEVDIIITMAITLYLIDCIENQYPFNYDVNHTDLLEDFYSFLFTYLSQPAVSDQHGFKKTENTAKVVNHSLTQ